MPHRCYRVLIFFWNLIEHISFDWLPRWLFKLALSKVRLCCLNSLCSVCFDFFPFSVRLSCLCHAILLWFGLWFLKFFWVLFTFNVSIFFPCSSLLSYGILDGCVVSSRITHPNRSRQVFFSSNNHDGLFRLRSVSVSLRIFRAIWKNPIRIQWSGYYFTRTWPISYFFG